MIRLLIGSIVVAVALSGAPRIARSEIDVRTDDGRVYSVLMRIFTTAEAWSAPSHTLERVAGARLLEIRATLDNGLNLEPKLEPSGAVDRVVFSQPLPKNATYELVYSIAVDPGHTARIPLSVPEIPVSGGARSVRIEVTPPDGYLVSGDAFPAFEQDTAELANFPSHIEVEIGKRPRRSTPALLSDLGVVLLLAGGTVARVLLRRKGSQA
jgi:hypothetical protein